MDEHSVLLQPTACTDAVAAPPRYSPLPGAMVTLHRTAGPPGSHPAKIPFWPVTVETRPTCWARNTSVTSTVGGGAAACATRTSWPPALLPQQAATSM